MKEGNMIADVGKGKTELENIASFPNISKSLKGITKSPMLFCNFS